MQLSDWAEKQKKRKPNKFHAVKVELDGYTFDSKAEARYWEELKLRVACPILSGRIRHVVVHPGYDLGSCYYKADFAFEEWRVWDSNNEPFWGVVIVDIKGHLTRDCAIKLKLMREKYGIEVRVLTKETNPSLFR